VLSERRTRRHPPRLIRTIAVIMRSTNIFLALFTSIIVPFRAQGADDGGNEAEECTCSGLDYADGGSYLINADSEDEFTFTSVFEGTIHHSSTTLQTRGAHLNRMLRIYDYPYPCFARWRWLRMLPDRVLSGWAGTILVMVSNDHSLKRMFRSNVTVKSGISYSEMSSGTWTVLLEAPEHEFTIQRQFNLTMGARNDNTVTVTVRSPTTSVLG
jgi:hypothetical protein